jgi:uncharacterized membrane protein YecN with MAPEG domain
MLALIEYMYFGYAVGSARGRTGIKAPAVSGDEVFERYFRVHQNTLEQMVVFVPAIYATTMFVGELYAVAGGVAFMIGRAVYFRAYTKDPEKRGPGALITMLANTLMVLASLIAATIAVL